jgi:hypothetical protein
METVVKLHMPPPSGTTSMWRGIQQYPNIVMLGEKEPSDFCRNRKEIGAEDRQAHLN